MTDEPWVMTLHCACGAEVRRPISGEPLADYQALTDDARWQGWRVGAASVFCPRCARQVGATLAHDIIDSDGPPALRAQVGEEPPP